MRIEAPTLGQEREIPLQLPTEILDGVRGLASLYVMLCHARFFLFISVATVLQYGLLHGPLKLMILALALTRYGRAAVMLFFIVSGYAIHYRQAHQLARTATVNLSWLDFARRRVRRLYPPLIAALVVTIILDTLGNRFYAPLYHGTSPALDFPNLHLLHSRDIVGALLFVQGIVTNVPGTDTPLWSLAYEGFYYLIYPLTLLLNRRLGSTRTLMLSILPALVSFIGIRTHMLPQPGADVLCYWPVWVAGVWLADVRVQRVHVPTHIWHVVVPIGIIALCILGFIQMLPHNAVSALPGELMDSSWALCFVGPLGWLVASHHSLRMRERILRCARPALALGSMSYSLYVVHFPVLAFVSALWLSHHAALPRTPGLYLVGIVTALLAAYIVYLIAERPVTHRRVVQPPLPIAPEIASA